MLAAVLAVVLGACVGAGDTRPAPAPSIGLAPSPVGPAAPLPTTTSASPLLGTTGPSAMPEPERRLRLALGREPASLDPIAVRDQAGRLVVDAVNDSLTRMSSNLVVVQPAAATGWSSSPDLRTWTFELRRDATWHDGTPVVASDFVRAFQRLARGGDARAFNSWLVDPLRGGDGRLHLDAVDDTTLVIRLPRPTGDLPVLLSDPALAPRHPEGLDPEQPVGNGPFRLVEPWAHNQFVRLAPADDHWEPPLLDEVLLPIYAQSNGDEVQYADFRAGAVDVAGVPVDEIADARLLFGSGTDGYRGPGVLNGELTSIQYLGYATGTSPWDDPDLRRAVSLLIDRDVLVAQVGREARSAAQGLVPPGLPGSELVTCDICERDLVRSLELLAGVDELPTGPVRLLAPDDAASSRVAAAVAGSIEDGLEVPVVVDERPLADYAAGLRDGDFDLFLATYTASRPSMGGVVEPLLWSRSGRLDNPGRISAPEIDQALARGRTSISQTVRLAAWQDAEQFALDQALVAPLYSPRLRMIVAEGVLDLRLSPDGRLDLTGVDVVPEG